MAYLEATSLIHNFSDSQLQFVWKSSESWAKTVRKSSKSREHLW